MKSKSLIAVLFFSFLFLKTHAQFLDKSFYLVDSLTAASISEDDKKVLSIELSIYKKSNYDTSKLKCLDRIIENVQNEKIWLKYNKLMLDIAEAHLKKPSSLDSIYTGYVGLALNNFGYYYYNYTANQALALKYYQEGLDLNEKVKRYDNMMVGYSNIAGVWQNKGDLAKGLEYYQKSLSFENKVSKKELLFAPTNNIAQIYLSLGDTLNAVKNLKKCFALSINSNDKIMKATLLQNIGLLSYYTNDKSGLQSMKKALELRKQIKDYRGLVQSYSTLAGIEVSSKNLQSAELYLTEASKYIGKFENLNTEAMYYTQFSNLKNQQGKKEEAIFFLEKGIETYSKFSQGIEHYRALNNLIHLYGNDPKYTLKKLKAYEYFVEIQKKIDNGNVQKLLVKQKYEEDIKIKETKFKMEQQLEEEKSKTEKHKQQLILLTVLVILFAVIIFSFFIYRSLKANKEKSKIISEQKIEVEQQKHLLEEKHKDITDSINYAQKIQSALIVSEEKLSSSFKEAFVIFKPRDVVSGDFYWYTEHKGTKIIALADCTGHGVPGAFMSMIGITLLNQIVNEKDIVSPAQILNMLRKDVIKALRLNSDGSDKRDGMDMAIISYNEKEVCYAGANSQALMINNGELVELKPNKQPIGIYEKLADFTEQKIEITPNLKVYLFSDGVVDQFGGPGGKKIKTKQFKEWLLASSNLSLNKQKFQIESNLINWKEGFEQTDDISLIGIRIS